MEKTGLRPAPRVGRDGYADLSRSRAPGEASSPPWNAKKLHGSYKRRAQKPSGILSCCSEYSFWHPRGLLPR